MMKWIISSCSFVLMMITAGCAGSMDEQVADEGKESEAVDAELDFSGEGGPLWKVVHDETTVFLHGTIHLGHEEYYPLASEIEEAYEEADVILPEINLFEAELDEAEVMRLALFEDGRTLGDVLSASSYDELDRIFQDNGLALEEYESFQPWFVGTVLGELGNQGSLLAPEYGVDLYFLQRALEDEKEITELETIEGQYEVLSGYSMETQVQVLESTIDTFGEFGQSVDHLGAAWIQNDVNGLTEQLSEGLASFDEEYRQRLNDERNVEIAEKLDAILQTNDGRTYFALVGSAHVLIDPSVPDELEERGYAVERVQ